MVPVYIVGALAVVLAMAVVSRTLATWAAPVLYVWADGDHLRLTAYLLALWACVAPLVLAALAVRSRVGRWWSVPVWVVVAGLGLLLLGFVPGRNNGGRLSRELSVASGGTLTDTGDIYVWTALAGVIGIGLVVPLIAQWVFEDRRWTHPRPGRAFPGMVAYIAGWIGAGALVLAGVGDTPARITWLEETARVLPGGDAGVTGGFHIGLDTSLVDVVDCDTAATALRVDGEVPELDGCRRGLLVAATGRYDQRGQRLASGELVAVVVQVRTEEQVASLDSALDSVELVEAGGLPQAPGVATANPATAALSLVIAAEDPAEIPLPAEGAGRRPLTRALAYVVIGSAVGLYLGPPEETPADAPPSRRRD
jgi:hypothetical protein